MLTYIVFDILEKDGKDLRELPLIERKAILQSSSPNPRRGSSSPSISSAKDRSSFGRLATSTSKGSSRSVRTHPIDLAAMATG